jgi:hypothetical protein
LLFQKTIDAVTTAKWNRRGEEAYLRFVRGDRIGQALLRKATVGLNADRKKDGIEPRRSFFC